MVRGKRDHIGNHNTGNIVLKVTLIRKKKEKLFLEFLPSEVRWTNSRLHCHWWTTENYNNNALHHSSQVWFIYWDEALVSIAENYLSRDEVKKLRDTCKKLEDKITQVLRDIQDILFVNKSKSIARLLPSFYDRRPFSNILTMESESSEASNDSGNISYQILAKKFFSKRIQEEVAAQKVKTNSNLSRGAGN